MHALIQTEDYQADVKTAGVSDDELAAIEATISANPEIGEVIVGTGGARKVRIGGKGKGKSGGYRVFFYYAAVDVPIFLLRIISKGQRANITKAERNGIRDVLSTLADDYRAMVKREAIKQRRRRLTVTSIDT